MPVSASLLLAGHASLSFLNFRFSTSVRYDRSPKKAFLSFFRVPRVTIVGTFEIEEIGDVAKGSLAKSLRQ